MIQDPLPANLLAFFPALSVSFVLHAEEFSKAKSVPAVHRCIGVGSVRFGGVDIKSWLLLRMKNVESRPAHYT